MRKEENPMEKQVEVEIESAEKDEKTVLAEKIREIKGKELPFLRTIRLILICLLIFIIALIFTSLVTSRYEALEEVFWLLPFFNETPELYFYALTISITGSPVLLWSGIFGVSLAIRSRKEQLNQYEDDLDLLEIAEGDHTKRSEKLFRNHQRELKRYYDINLGHYRWIFPVGVMTVILGSAIIGGTIWVFRGAIKDSIAPILIGAVSGVLVDFIGAVLIHMYTETVKSSIAFHSQLMKSNHALFANMLAFKIKDESKQDDTFAELAKLMIQAKEEPKK